MFHVFHFTIQGKQAAQWQTKETKGKPVPRPINIMYVTMLLICLPFNVFGYF